MPDETFPGRISISGGSDSLLKRTIHITITDESSGCQQLVATLTPEQFGLALSGLGNTPCTFSVFTVPTGYVREYKKETIAVPVKHTDEEEAEALAPFETDGWVAMRKGGLSSQLLNMHERQGGAVAVHFIRYVHPETGHIWGQPNA